MDLTHLSDEGLVANYKMNLAWAENFMKFKDGSFEMIWEMYVEPYLEEMRKRRIRLEDYE